MSQVIIDATVQFVKESLPDNDGGHDWWHLFRVWQLAKSISQTEKADLLVVELAALLHDIADSKFSQKTDQQLAQLVINHLQSLKLDEQRISQVVEVITTMSFRKTFDTSDHVMSIERAIVQDADRLDALGAIGIARMFAHGGAKSRTLYDPDIPPRVYRSTAEYQQSNSPSLNHIQEKLLLLKDTMQTKTGRRLAKRRHQFVQVFYEQFIAEWQLQV